MFVFLSSFEKNLRFLMKTFQDFYPYSGLQWTPNGWRSKYSFSAASKGYKQYQMMNKGIHLKKEIHKHFGWLGVSKLSGNLSARKMYKSLVALRAGSLQILEARKLIQLAQIRKSDKSKCQSKTFEIWNLNFTFIINLDLRSLSVNNGSVW